MYCQDTSTSSSEDEASTAAAAAATSTTTTTADMCRSEERNGEKVVRCTGCGYTSDRRANVTRHYGRIHAVLKREKYRECPCGDVFQTKWEFYNHCVEHHPSFRQSSYTTTNVYKLQETKSELKQQSAKARPRTRSEQSYKAPARRLLRRSDKPYRPPVTESLPTYASTMKLRSHSTCSTLNSNSSTGSFSVVRETSSIESSSSGGDTSSRRESSFRSSESEDTSYDNSATSLPASGTPESEDTGYGDSATSSTPFHNSESEDTNDEKSASNLMVFRTSESEDTGDENAMTSFAHLPIKKRYMESVRKVLGDITNQSKVEVQKVNSDNDNKNNQVSIRDLYLSKMNEKQRAFIGHIDFDELEAILKLCDMKKGI